MSKQQESKSVLKDNWYLIAAAVVLLLGGATMALMSGGESDEGQQTGVIGSAGDGVDIVRLGDVDLVDRETTERYEGLSQEEKDQKYIEQYEAKLADDPDSAEAAQTMSALAVVYRRQGKYDEASVVLEDILVKFPGTPNARTAMIVLPEVYQQSGNVSLAREAYQRMIDYFPPESEEHKYAKQRYDEL